VFSSLCICVFRCVFRQFFIYVGGYFVIYTVVSFVLLFR